MNDKFKEIDAKEIMLPETTYSRDVESRVFQAIIFQCLSKIDSIALVGGSLIDSLLGRDSNESFNGIHVEQDQKKHSISIRLEVNILHGVSIPQKSEEIQNKIVEEISTFTGLHVEAVHVVFKNLIMQEEKDEAHELTKKEAEELVNATAEDEYEGF